MQICPLYAKAPARDLFMASTKLALSVTITPAFPPNSKTIFFFPLCVFIFQPTSGEPVKLKSLKRSSVTIRFPVSRFIGKIETEPFGSGVLSMTLASSKVESGVEEAGFKMIGQPAAIAGAILCTAKFIGKLKGEIPATNPTGKYFTNPSLLVPIVVQSNEKYSLGK